MTGAADSYATLTFTYNKDAELATEATSGPGTGQPTVTLTYSYDQLGDETSVSDSLSSQGITTYAFDVAQRVTTITTSYGGTTGPEVTYTYDGANRMTNEFRTIGGTVSTTSDGIGTVYSYDSANRVVTIADNAWQRYLSGYSDTALVTYVYGYDSASRVTSELDKEGTATFTYDNANELTAVGGSRTESYGYDLNGNRNTTGYTTGTENEQTASPGYTYTYDSEGNLTAQTNTSTHVITSYTYDFHNRLTEVKVGGTIEATYTYDALDRRIGIDDNGTQTWTAYDGTSADAQPYADFSSSGSLAVRYLNGPGVVLGGVVDELLARTSSSGTTAWYLPDNLGAMRDIISIAGAVQDHVVYDSFGNIVTETNATNGDRFKYAGMQYDPTTGGCYDHARNYAPTIGAFTSQDPIAFSAGDTNLHRYVTNSPTNHTDPTGEDDQQILAQQLQQLQQRTLAAQKELVQLRVIEGDLEKRIAYERIETEYLLWRLANIKAIADQNVDSRFLRRNSVGRGQFGLSSKSMGPTQGPATDPAGFQTDTSKGATMRQTNGRPNFAPAMSGFKGGGPPLPPGQAYGGSRGSVGQQNTGPNPNTPLPGSSVGQPSVKGNPTTGEPDGEVDLSGTSMGILEIHRAPIIL